MYLIDNDRQGERGFFCDVENFLQIRGPSDFVVTGHATDCDTLANDSMSYLYLHRSSEQDRRSNLIFRWSGDTASVSWTDSMHVVIRAESSRYVDMQHSDHSDIYKQVAILDGIHISYIGFRTSQTPPGDKSH